MVSSRSPSTRSRFAALGDPGADVQPPHGQQDRPVLVQDVEVGLDPGAVGSGHPRVAVAGVAGRAVGAQPAHTQRQQQAAVADVLDTG